MLCSGRPALRRVEDDEVPHLFGRVTEGPAAAQPTGAWTERDAALQIFAVSASRLASPLTPHTRSLKPRATRNNLAPEVP
jgi:hypothetical protein